MTYNVTAVIVDHSLTPPAGPAHIEFKTTDWTAIMEELHRTYCVMYRGSTRVPPDDLEIRAMSVMKLR